MPAVQSGRQTASTTQPGGAEFSAALGHAAAARPEAPPAGPTLQKKDKAPDKAADGRAPQPYPSTALLLPAHPGLPAPVASAAGGGPAHDGSGSTQPEVAAGTGQASQAIVQIGLASTMLDESGSAIHAGDLPRAVSSGLSPAMIAEHSQGNMLRGAEAPTPVLKDADLKGPSVSGDGDGAPTAALPPATPLTATLMGTTAPKSASLPPVHAGLTAANADAAAVNLMEAGNGQQGVMAAGAQAFVEHAAAGLSASAPGIGAGVNSGSASGKVPARPAAPQAGSLRGSAANVKDAGAGNPAKSDKGPATGLAVDAISEAKAGHDGPSGAIATERVVPSPQAAGSFNGTLGGTLGGPLGAATNQAQAGPAAGPAQGAGDAARLPVTSAAPAADVTPLPAINSSRVLQSMQGTEMRVGMHSAEFGNVSISTSIGGSGGRQMLAAQISFDHSDLGRALAVHLPAMEAKLTSDYGVHTRIEVHDQSLQQGTDGDAGTPQGRSGQGGSPRNTSGGASGEASLVVSAASREEAATTAGLSARLDVRG